MLRTCQRTQSSNIQIEKENNDKVKMKITKEKYLERKTPMVMEMLPCQCMDEPFVVLLIRVLIILHHGSPFSNWNHKNEILLQMGVSFKKTLSKIFISSKMWKNTSIDLFFYKMVFLYESKVVFVSGVNGIGKIFYTLMHVWVHM